MLTWPLVFEQFMNERLVVEVKGCGVRIHSKRRTSEGLNETVTKDVIAKTISQFMESEEGEKARFMANEMAKTAKAAMEENGSSKNDLNRLIYDLMSTKKLTMFS
ncbi:hypothetical protein LUZ60_006677 [Juncus effusus]|nr:hypothetical protein LUZ60_006677 [Juncus effusus]